MTDELPVDQATNPCIICGKEPMDQFLLEDVILPDGTSAKRPVCNDCWTTHKDGSLHMPMETACKIKPHDMCRRNCRVDKQREAIERLQGKRVAMLSAELALQYYYSDMQWESAVEHAADRAVRYISGQMGEREVVLFIPKRLRSG